MGNQRLNASGGATHAKRTQHDFGPHPRLNLIRRLLANASPNQQPYENQDPETAKDSDVKIHNAPSLYGHEEQFTSWDSKGTTCRLKKWREVETPLHFPRRFTPCRSASRCQPSAVWELVPAFSRPREPPLQCSRWRRTSGTSRDRSG